MTPTLIEIGYLQKNHGFKGDIRFQFNVDLNKETALPKFLWIYQEGKPVPYFVERHKMNTEDSGTIHFEDIESEEATFSLRNKGLFCEEKDFDLFFSNKETLDILIGFCVIDKKHGDIGKITGIIENTFHPTIEINNKGTEILIPYTDEIVSDINHDKKQMEVDTPDGLLDVYL
ncbi:MAG: ribosome maturation factor RimM [Chitinophagales bacterium]